MSEEKKAIKNAKITPECAEDPHALAKYIVEHGKVQGGGNTIKTSIEVAREVLKERGTTDEVIDNFVGSVQHLTTAGHIAAREMTMKKLGENKPSTFDEMKGMSTQSVVFPTDMGTISTSVTCAKSWPGVARKGANGEMQQPEPSHKIGIDNTKFALKRCDPSAEVVEETRKMIGNATNHLDEVAKLLAD